jgi:hypothetical protein
VGYKLGNIGKVMNRAGRWTGKFAGFGTIEFDVSTATAS